MFVVHGRDLGARDSAARLLDKLGLEPVILRDLPNEGKTVIEKFVSYADVAFAIVLLTPDDQCIGPDPGKPERRARQNVILELGFFLGQLGRNRVCALYKGDVEIPSDYSGVVFVKMDDTESWHREVARELEAAGLPLNVKGVL